ncbi:MAG: hypothetical protein BWK78_02655, partial [Thiotrichaceae bacterium IS1]
LEAVAFKILQIQEWLEETHVGCVRQLEFCQEAILQAHAHDSPDDDALSDAYDQLKEAQEQFDNFLSWKQQVEEAILEYQQQAVLMKTQLEDDVTKAEFFLEEHVAKLEEYFAVSPPLGRSSTVISIDSWRKTNDQTVSGNNRKVAFENAEPTTQGNLLIEAGKFSESELRAAQYMATRGHQVILRQPTGTRIEGGTSDLLVDGVRYDVYTPITDRPNRIISAIAKKNQQTEGIVLDLTQTTVTPAQLGNILCRVQGVGATNIKYIVIIGTENHAQY